MLHLTDSMGGTMATQVRTIFGSTCLLLALSLPTVAAHADNTETPPASIPIDTGTPVKVVKFNATPDVPQSRTDPFNSPQDDGRPGEYFFYLGALANQRQDYAHAIAMYKVAASWAYKPAEYNLGVLYLNGHGSPVDLPRAMAWFALAAERGDTQYVYAKQLLYSHLTPEQFEQANVIWRELLPTYGDAVALPRAKARWRETLYAATGSRVGSAATHVVVGGMLGHGGHNSPLNYDFFSGGMVATTPGEITGAHQTDGVIAYQQLRDSKDPYDPRFDTYLLSGTVTVGVLKPVKTPFLDTPPQKDGDVPPNDSDKPKQP